jgi:tetratricopeptide (TPR) repeat protein
VLNLIINYRNADKLEKVEELYSELSKLSIETGNQEIKVARGKAIFFHIIDYWKVGKLEKAEELYSELSKLSIETGNQEIKMEQGQALYVLKILYGRAGEAAKVKEYQTEFDLILSNNPEVAQWHEEIVSIQQSEKSK